MSDLPVFSVYSEYSVDFDGVMNSYVDCFLQELLNRGLLLEPESVDVVLPDLKDIPFYIVTLSSGIDSTYLVTGNLKHFPEKPFVVTPTQFLEILKNMKSQGGD